ncbi:cysteine-rich RLK (RECEPTOR-like protein kinase) 8 [Striga hermonthica]|uniref:Cysteine-rich RLK (RECEPTOR-like protein kinase) 8 n=1 Tax=Striga hermonthica TaxID=68872 RepID=A0A9N7NX11_STRHE|nr:cysteine-rich RLK (RECEPTOR-like protein kinase) 8 [Striga hermonthica]
MVKTQFKRTVKVVRSDNGQEFVGTECQGIFSEEGILHQRTCVYTPQQNGVVERKHKQILEIARSCLFQSGLPLKFWTYGILTAAYIINRLPSSSLNWDTPYERVYNKTADYHRLKPFGCLVYAVNTLPSRSKLDPRSHKCVFIGYVAGCKGYHLYDLENNKVIISRDVVFFTDTYPYKNEAVKETEITTTLPVIHEDLSYTKAPAQNGEDQEVTDERVMVEDIGKRKRNKPAWMKDYICDIGETGSMSSQNEEFFANLAADQEPFSYHQAKTDKKWVEAMNNELKALELNGTWKLCYLPTGKKAIGSKWVFKVKRKANGEVDRYKARLVAKGYSQTEGVDYFEVFSPVAKMVTVRAFIAMVAMRGWKLWQLDVNNAFLHGYLSEEVYMKPPQGYTKAKEGQVCHLVKSLYGLKQASREWNTELTKKVLEFGLVQSSYDNCLFTQRGAEGYLAMLVYVDDVLFTASNIQLLEGLKRFLDKEIHH